MPTVSVASSLLFLIQSTPAHSPTAPTLSPTTSSDSTSSSKYTASSKFKMAPCNSKPTTIEQDAPSKVPILLPGDLNASIMHNYIESCKGYFNNKEITPEKQVCRILASIKDSCYRDWISSDHPH